MHEDGHPARRGLGAAGALASGIAVATLLVTLTGCAHVGNDEDVPTLNMEAQPLAAAADKTTSCTEGTAIETVKGPVPSGAVEVVTMTVKADRAVPFWMFEQAARQRAAQYCSDGVSVLRAVAEPGDALFHEIQATGWRRSAAAEGE